MKSLKPAKDKLAYKIDDATAPAGIADLLKKKFSSVLHEINDNPYELELENKMLVTPLSGAVLVSCEEVGLHASTLADGKCPVC